MGSLIEGLGLNWQDMLVYLGVIIILILVYRFLIFKHVKKNIDARKQRLEEINAENAVLNKESLELKHKYEGMLADAKQEVTRVSEEVTQKAQARGDEIIARAEKHAEEIVAAAKHEVETEKARLASEYKETVADISVKIAEKVLEREVSSKDNQKVIDEFLTEWSKG